MKNIHVIPTDKPSKGYILGKCIKELSDVKIGQFTRTHYLMFDEEYFQAHNIYITSDEEIKEEDWYLDLNLNKIKKALEVKIDRIYYTRYYCTTPNKAKKIIMTTDPDLIEDGVQAIDDEFLEWFIKNPSCESIEIIQMCRTCGAEGKEGDNYCERSKECNRGWAGEKYKIIFPKEEPKQPIQKLIDENYGENVKIDLDNNTWEISFKQETLEEAGLKHCSLIDRFQGLENPLYSFKAGAKWQAERMYSEEEILKIITEFKSYLSFGDEVDETQWFEKIKKK